jgi:hypothetical protein
VISSPRPVLLPVAAVALGLVVWEASPAPAATPTAQEALLLKPRQPDVDCDRPSNDEAATATIKQETFEGFSAFVVRTADGRFGGRPIWYTMSGCVKEAGDRRLRRAPNRPRARHKRAAFSSMGRTHRSMSPVARGTPCPATAYPPTTRYSTFSAAKSFNISAKSRFIARTSTEGPSGKSERPDQFDSLGRGHSDIGIWFSVAAPSDPLMRDGGRGGAI